MKAVSDGQKATEAYLLRERGCAHVQTDRRQTRSERGHNFPRKEGLALDSTMLPSPGNRRARTRSTGNLPSTSAFFLFVFFLKTVEI